MGDLEIIGGGGVGGAERLKKSLGILRCRRSTHFFTLRVYLSVCKCEKWSLVEKKRKLKVPKPFCGGFCRRVKAQFGLKVKGWVIKSFIICLGSWALWPRLITLK